MARTNDEASVDLETTLRHLRLARRQLKNIDEDELDALPVEEQHEWARSLQRLSVAITKLETADLQNLSDEFVAKEPQLRATAAQLDDDLGQLADAVAMIHVASTALDTVTSIVTLLV